jgi:hypothetical protein
LPSAISSSVVVAVAGAALALAAGDAEAAGLAPPDVLAVGCAEAEAEAAVGWMITVAGCPSTSTGCAVNPFATLDATSDATRVTALFAVL